MNWTSRIVSLSRPLTLVACMVVFVTDPRLTAPSLALYVVSAAFFITSSAVILGWLSAGYRWQFWTTWVELALITYLNWHSLYYYGNNAGTVCYVVAAVSIPLVLDRKAWKAGFLILAASLIVTTATAMRNEPWQQTILVMLIFCGAMLFMGSTGVLLRNLEKERDRSRRLLKEVTESRAALERAHRQLQESAARQQEMAVIEERQRLAREIHDSVAHGLTALVVQTQAARKLLARDPARAAETVAKCEEMARDALQETRRAVRALHPSGLEQRSDVEALQRLARDYGIATEMRVEVRADEGARSLAPDPARLEQLYRIFQESLTNAHRHGQAKSVVATLSVADGMLTLVITNDGEAPCCLDPGVGLKSMSERAHAIGGTFEIEPDTVGLTVRVTVPLKQEVAG
ncbi:MAG TPA: sensor histidine kinase [Symbiobacteriaceae bacterium]|nr:sensor histidine kinase [Symbiobacteriaceae bacterium]